MTDQEKIRLRLLREGKPQPEDFLEAEWLAEHGFIRARFRYSHRKTDAGAIDKVIWIGVTPAGRDYLAALEAKCYGQDKNGDIAPADKDVGAAVPPARAKRFYQRLPWRELIIGLVVTVGGGLLLALLLRALGWQ